MTFHILSDSPAFNKTPGTVVIVPTYAEDAPCEITRPQKLLLLWYPTYAEDTSCSGGDPELTTTRVVYGDSARGYKPRLSATDFLRDALTNPARKIADINIPHIGAERHLFNRKSTVVPHLPLLLQRRISIYSSGPTQGTYARSCRSHRSHPAT